MAGISTYASTSASTIECIHQYLTVELSAHASATVYNDMFLPLPSIYSP